jgi:hypothetical protein
MTTLGLRECDRLEGASNFTPWKCRLQMLLEEVELWEHVKTKITIPTNLKLLDEHNKKEAKAKRIILDKMKDHLITHIVEKKISKEMYDVLVTLYQIVSVSRKMLLRNKLSAIYTRDTNTMVSYLARITELRDQSAAIGTKVVDEELMVIALNGFASSWKPFVQGVCAHEKLPSFEKLWDDFVQKEVKF